MQGKLKDGFEWNIADTAFDNMELLDLLADIQDGDIIATSKVMTLFLGSEQKKALYDFYRREDGTVPVEKITSAFVEILESKN